MYTANGLFFYFNNSITICQTAQSGQTDVNILTVCSITRKFAILVTKI